MPNAQQTLDQLCQYTRQTAVYASISALLQWDERTIMPPAAGEYRAEQVTLLSGVIHEREIAPQVGQWLAELAESPLAKDHNSDAGATIRQLKRRYEKKIKLPTSLVEELTRTAVLGQQIWQEARKKDDFAAFQPILTKMIDLKRQEAEALGYEECPYDALLDEYEQGEKTSNIAGVLAGLRDELVPLAAAIAESKRRPDRSLLERRCPADAQERFGKQVAENIGYEFQRGRLDVTAHPFCETMGPHDVRITTRYNEYWFPGSFFGILHEAGHGLYEQGLRPEWYGLPPGQAISLGIHESQSRMWENFVGRSRGFWQHFFPMAQAAFSEALRNVTPDDFYFAINEVRPSLIRVEADEATYNLHILIRFELERALLDGDLQAPDLPSAWKDKYQEFLGIKSPTDADGVLQDVHWSAGLIGYFPTYSLGNLYAAQFFEQAEDDLGGLADQFRRGEFRPLRDWLREKIHAPGQCYTADQLVRRVTGKPLSHEPLMRHLQGRFGPLYGI
jgi:carboxypeptidase Taq